MSCENFVERFVAKANESVLRNGLRPLMVGIDSKVLRQNAQRLNERLCPGTICGVLKGDAYGHGVRNIVPYINDCCSHFAIVDNAEAMEIRVHEKSKPIIRLRPGTTLEIRDAIDNGLQIREHVGSVARLAFLQELAKEYDTVIDIHLSVNAGGLGRAGIDIFDPKSTLRDIQTAVAYTPIRIASVGCHTQIGQQHDPLGLSAARTVFDFARQLNDCNLSQHGKPIEVSIFSSASSIACIDHDLLKHGLPIFHRIGNSLYGLASSENYREPGIKQVMHAATHVCETIWRPAGTPVGYESAYTTITPGESIAILGVGWSTWGRTYQGIGKSATPAYVLDTSGRPHPLVGRQSMNIATIRATASGTTLLPGDVVFITTAGDCWPDGAMAVTVEAIAALMGNVQHEYVTSLLGSSPSAIRFVF